MRITGGLGRLVRYLRCTRRGINLTACVMIALLVGFTVLGRLDILGHATALIRSGLTVTLLGFIATTTLVIAADDSADGR